MHENRKIKAFYDFTRGVDTFYHENGRVKDRVYHNARPPKRDLAAEVDQLSDHVLNMGY